MKKSFFFSIFVFSLLGTSSCTKCPCATALGLLPAFIGYSEEQTDTLIVRQYTNTGTFTQLVDTILVDKNILVFGRNNDTLSPIVSSVNFSIKEGADYEIFIPAVNKTYRITQLLETHNKEACNSLFNRDKDFCINGVQSYGLDGVKISPQILDVFFYLK